MNSPPAKHQSSRVGHWRFDRGRSPLVELYVVHVSLERRLRVLLRYRARIRRAVGWRPRDEKSRCFRIGSDLHLLGGGGHVLDSPFRAVGEPLRAGPSDGDRVI
jgi:hypothetical protein